MNTLATIESATDGRARTARSLRTTLAGERLAHAYLFHGPTGAGKAETARALAAARMCTEARDGSCGQCRACKLVFADGHPDLHWVEPDNGRTIGVDQVRKLLSALTLAPLEGPGRMAVIQPACSMPEAAANALLKTLEEPPRGALLVLLTPRPDLLLPTIRSRCVQLRFPPREVAVDEAPEGSYAHSIAEAAKALLDRRGDAFDRAERCYALVEKAAADDDSGATLTERRRRAALAALDSVVARLRKPLRDLAISGRGLQRLATAVERLVEAGRQLESNAIPLLVLEVLALDLDVAAGRRPAPKPLYFGQERTQ